MSATSHEYVDTPAALGGRRARHRRERRYRAGDGDRGAFVDGIEVPLAPFPGNLGVAPAASGPHSTIPPRRVGGNVDVKHLTAGSTLYLPVEVAGALFSIGDCHATQGDGEVCVTGIEAPMSVTARLRLVSERSLEQPEFETTGPFSAHEQPEAVYGTTGVSDDLMDATTLAVSCRVPTRTCCVRRSWT